MSPASIEKDTPATAGMRSFLRRRRPARRDTTNVFFTPTSSMSGVTSATGAPIVTHREAPHRSGYGASDDGHQRTAEAKYRWETELILFPQHEQRREVGDEGETQAEAHQPSQPRPVDRHRIGRQQVPAVGERVRDLHGVDRPEGAGGVGDPRRPEDDRGRESHTQ